MLFNSEVWSLLFDFRKSNDPLTTSANAFEFDSYESRLGMVF